jgi:hypothetical protein
VQPRGFVEADRTHHRLLTVGVLRCWLGAGVVSLVVRILHQVASVAELVVSVMGDELLVFLQSIVNNWFL